MKLNEMVFNFFPDIGGVEAGSYLFNNIPFNNMYLIIYWSAGCSECSENGAEHIPGLPP
jgi:hypothetical protein